MQRNDINMVGNIMYQRQGSVQFNQTPMTPNNPGGNNFGPFAAAAAAQGQAQTNQSGPFPAAAAAAAAVAAAAATATATATAPATLMQEQQQQPPPDQMNRGTFLLYILVFLFFVCFAL